MVKYLAGNMCPQIVVGLQAQTIIHTSILSISKMKNKLARSGGKNHRNHRTITHNHARSLIGLSFDILVHFTIKPGLFLSVVGKPG